MELQSVSDSTACAYGYAPAPWEPPDSSSVDVNHYYVPGSNPSSTTGFQCDLGQAINSSPTYQTEQIKREKAPYFTRALGEEADRACKYREPCEKHCRKKKNINKGNYSCVSLTVFQARALGDSLGAQHLFPSQELGNRDQGKRAEARQRAGSSG